MIEPGASRDESDRLRALREVQLLDTDREERFDRIIRIAQAVFDVPIVAFSLVDSDRQWFKSAIGLDLRETPRDVSFCGHAILQEAPLVVRDTLDDDRFGDNPLVVGEPRIRFYAGYPVRGPRGHALGTLCLIDREPRTLDPRETTLLADLAALVEDEVNRAHLLESYEALVTEGMALREFLDADIHLIYSADSDDRFTYVNKRSRERLGHTEADLRRMTTLDIVADVDRDRYRALVAELLDDPDGKPRALSASLVTKSGELVRVAGSVSRLRLTDGSRGTRAIFRDVSHQEDELASLKTDFAHFDEVAGTLTDVFWVTDAVEHAVLYVSPAYETLWGRPREQIYAQPWDWLESIHPDDRAEAESAFARAIEHNVPFDIEFRIVRPDGSVRHIHDRGDPVAGEDGVVVRIAGVATDVTRRTELERSLRALAETDELTGLATRRVLNETATTVLRHAARDDKAVSVALIDVDRFKPINDRWGHAAGDRALQVVARVLKDHVRRGDLPARIGGDEFCVLLDGARLTDGLDVMRRFLAALRADRLTLDDADPTTSISLSCSIGVAEWNRTESFQRLRRRADQALYTAKRDGRAQIAVAEAP